MLSPLTIPAANGPTSTSAPHRVPSPAGIRGILLPCLVGVSALLGGVLTEANGATLKGSRSCKEWTEIREDAANGKQAAKLDEMTTKYWIIGYLSALVGTQSDLLRNDPLKSTRNEKIYGTIDSFCLTNPDKSLPDAITALWLDIARFKKPKK